MRATRGQKAEETRARVLDASARLFRERGFGGIGVADLMKSVGLTHGGFYAHFTSKDELKAEACERATKQVTSRWRQVAGQHPGDALSAVVKAYLSPLHRDHPGEGCVLATLGGEAAREGPLVRHALSNAAKEMLDTLLEVVPGSSPNRKRQRAAVTLAGMVGAVVLARAVDDQRLANEILSAVRATMAQRGDEEEQECGSPPREQ